MFLLEIKEDIFLNLTASPCANFLFIFFWILLCSFLDTSLSVLSLLCMRLIEIRFIKVLINLKIFSTDMKWVIQSVVCDDSLHSKLTECRFFYQVIYFCLHSLQVHSLPSFFMLSGRLWWFSWVAILKATLNAILKHPKITHTSMILIKSLYCFNISGYLQVKSPH